MNNSSSTFWSTSIEELLASLDSSWQGIDQRSALDRLQRLSGKILGREKRSSWAILASQFNNPIIWLLFASAVLSYFLDDAINSIIIFIILLLSGLLGYWQERTAADAVAKLLAFIETQVRVRRDGNEVSIGLQSLVPGDIVLLKAGTVIPGDCRLLDSRELHVNESALTGESFPVEKETKRLPVDTPIAQRTNCLHLGTHVVSGSGTAVVVRIGKETALGEISSRLAKKPPKTSFERSLDQFGKLLLGITIALVMIVLCAQLLFQRPFVESLLFALALAVGMTPQLLPAITSVVLAKGAKAMAKEEVIVKKLLAIENFGSMNVLCVDKTGTLTEGTVKLSQTLDGFGTPSLHVLRLAQINATLQASFENPIDTAIRSEAGPDLRNVKKLDELPYDFNRRRLSVLYECEQEIGMVTKGAFASVIEICHQINQQGGSVDISPHLTSIQATFETLSQQGFRVLGVASRRLDSDTLSKTDEVGMTFEGFLVLADPLKPFIRETKSQLEELGITLKLITGDNRVVAASIAKQVGLRNGHCVTGKDIQQFSPEALQRSVLETDVFAEIEPNQKERIILALKDAGLIVGFLGDGINDAPALHSADVGISVASAVDVAKEAAQVVLLQHDIQVLAKGVREGRKTLANTLKYVFVSISANFGYMLSTALASFFLPFLPLLPVQILLINLLADFPAMALAADSVDPELIQRPRRWDIPAVLKFMILFGLIGTISDLITFAILLYGLHVGDEEFRTGWFVVSIMTGLLIMLSVRTQRPFFRSQPGSLLLLAALGVSVTTLVLPMTPFNHYFGLSPLTWKLVAIVGTVSLIYAFMIEMGKLYFYRVRRRAATGAQLSQT